MITNSIPATFTEVELPSLSNSPTCSILEHSMVDRVDLELL